MTKVWKNHLSDFIRISIECLFPIKERAPGLNERASRLIRADNCAGNDVMHSIARAMWGLNAGIWEHKPMSGDY